MSWWRRLWARRRLEEQLEKELRFHLDQHTTDLIARGHDPRSARRLAVLALGGPEQVKENCRDARGTRWLEDVWHDVRYALRTLRRQPGFSAIAILTLALGSGATTVMYTVIDGVLLRPLSYPDPERLLRLSERTDWSTKLGNEWAFSYPNFLDCQRASQRLAPLAAWRYAGGIVSEPRAAEYVDGRQISSELFPVLGIGMLQGRAFLPAEDRPGAAPVAIISRNLWQQRYGESRDAIGKPLVFDGKAYTVVGIARAGFQLSGEADVFTPLGQNTEPVMQRREAHPGIGVVARLKKGVTLAQAQSELALIGHRLAEQYPKSNAGRTFFAERLRPDVTPDIRSSLWLLMGAVTLVLLIACVNVASLLLARAVSREREVAMRMALGASRGRLIRQYLTESGVLGLAGGAVGILLAALVFIRLCCSGRTACRAPRKSNSIGVCCCLPSLSRCSADFFSGWLLRFALRDLNWNRSCATVPGRSQAAHAGCTVDLSSPRLRLLSCS